MPRLHFHVHGDKEICIGENRDHAFETGKSTICLWEMVVEIIIKM
jgi:hypothetical protein